MTLTFDARIEGKTIVCHIASDHAIAAPVWCFSLMAKPRVLRGGTLLRTVAGYGEVALPDLAPGVAQEVVLAHEDEGYRPWNRAWLPLGGYLRHGGGCSALPVLPAGVRPAEAPPPVPVEGLRLIPPPTRWEPSGGTLQAPGFAAQGEAFEAVDALARRTGLGAFLAPDGIAIAVEEDAGLAPDAYRIAIDEAITLTAGDRGGFFYGAITLLTLRQTHGGALPRGLIEDAPRFGWRGQHLDCARHFYWPETLHRLLDLMALMKLNRFHWHFADDEAFRLEVDCLPALWQKTAWRGEGELVPGVFGGGIRSGGSYSKAEVAALVAHASALNIEVMPEIEVPAHAHALNLAVAGMRDPGDNGGETSIQGYRENVLNPAMPKTWDTVEALADEVAGLFPFGHLHLGCDELPPGAWSGSPAVARLKAEQGLETSEDVQGWMMARLARRLVDRGIRPAAWEEAAKGAGGGIGHGAILFSWTGQGPGIRAARAGHPVVMCPAQNAYLDMAHSADPDDWGAAWAAFIALQDTLNWSPVPSGAEDIAAQVIGVQGTFWSEFTTEDRQIEAMLAPRILGLAAKAWDRADSLTGARLRALAGAYGPLFDRIGWDWNRRA